MRLLRYLLLSFNLVPTRFTAFQSYAAVHLQILVDVFLCECHRDVYHQKFIVRNAKQLCARATACTYSACEGVPGESSNGRTPSSARLPSTTIFCTVVQRMFLSHPCAVVIDYSH